MTGIRSCTVGTIIACLVSDTACGGRRDKTSDGSQQGDLVRLGKGCRTLGTQARHCHVSKWVERRRVPVRRQAFKGVILWAMVV